MSLKVLVIDDNRDYLKIISSQLMKFNYEIISEENPRKGLQYILNDEVDIAIIDFIMPDMNGLQILEEFIHIKMFFPSILLTAFGTSTLAVEWLKKGGSDYIEKPVSNYEILDLKIRLAVSQSILIKNNYQNQSWMDSNNILGIFSEDIKQHIQRIKGNLDPLKKETFWKQISPVENYIDSIERLVLNVK